MAAIIALGTGKPADLIAQKTLTGTLRNSKLTSDHVNEVTDGLEGRKKVLEKVATHTGSTREMIADLNDTITAVQANFAKAHNGQGTHDDVDHGKAPIGTGADQPQAQQQMHGNTGGNRQRT